MKNKEESEEVEEKEEVESYTKLPKAHVKVKVSGKTGRAYGEYGFRGDTISELKELGEGTAKIYKEHIENLKG